MPSRQDIGEVILRLAEVIAKDVSEIQRFMLRGFLFLAFIQVLEVLALLYLILFKGCTLC